MVVVVFCVCGGGGASFSNFWEPKMMSQAFLGPMPKLQLFQFFFSDSNNAPFWCRTLKLTLHDVSSNIQSVEYSVVTSLSWVLVFSFVSIVLTSRYFSISQNKCTVLKKSLLSLSISLVLYISHAWVNMWQVSSSLR